MVDERQPSTWTVVGRWVSERIEGEARR